MPRIPEAEIERLKREVPVEGLAREAGVELKQHGEELLGLCPFHDDKEPSLVVNPSKNLWHCLGACQAGGSVIDWVMRERGVAFREAVGVLMNHSAPSDPGQPRGVARTDNDESKSSVGAGPCARPEQAAETQRQLKRVMEYYHETLKESPEALAYLEKRGIADKDAVERFQLGYCDRSFSRMLPERNRVAGAEVRGVLEDVGILRGSGHEHFRGSLVIPVVNEDGIITEMYGRKIGSRLRKGTPLHLYLPGPHRGVWNVEALMASDEVILCESLIDALTFWCAGLRNVTCAYGIEGFTPDHLEAFRLYGIQKVYIAYDRDEAGDRAATALSKRLIADDIECFRVRFPKGMDANEYALKVSPAEKSLDLVIREAEWIGGKQSSLSVGAGPCARPGNGDEPESNTGRPRGVTPTVETSKPSIEAHIKPGEITFAFGDRRWRVRGLEKNMSFDALRVNVLAGCRDLFHVDTFDLCAARHRHAFVKQAAFELEIKEDIIKKDLGKVFLKLEELQEKQIHKKLAPEDKPAVTLSDVERKAAMGFLQSPDLMGRILGDFEKCGIVGEETNKLVGYLASCSRKLEEPLAVVIQSSSAAGKSALMEAVLSFLPPEEQVKYSAMTGQSLFYMGETDLKNKILAIVEEEGAERAAYALKLLQSEGELTIASTGKDPATGRLVTQEYRVEGPVMIFLTTTAIEIDEELLNRCIVLTVDENREQTRAIHKLQRKRQTLQGLLARRDSDGIRKVHQDAQRLLRPLLVANPFADALTFLDDRTRTRRDHMKYLTLIRSITLLHQYQREVKHVRHNGVMVEFIEVEVSDIEIANSLCHQVLGRSLDELAPQTRRLLIALDEMVKEKCANQGVDQSDCWFTRREVREYSGFGLTQTRMHLDKLVDLEYVLPHHGGRGQQFVYELLFDGEANTEPHLNGLIDVKALKNKRTTQTWRGGGDSWRPHGGPKTGGWRGEDRQVFESDSKPLTSPGGKSSEIASQVEKKDRRNVPVDSADSKAV